MRNDGEGENLTEYEKQRLSRIRENQARLEALGLPGLASHVRSDASKQAQVKSKRNKKTEPDEEEEYHPSDEDDDEEEEETMENRSSKEDMPSSSRSRRKGKKIISLKEQKPSKVSHLKRERNDGNFFDDDTALAQAIAMSLGESVQNESGAEKPNKAVRKSNSTTKVQKLKDKPGKSRIQLSEDEVIGFFFSFDEVGKGYITAYDIEKMAVSHDFTWTDGEIAKMVRCFDSDGDRKLSLEDFRSIVSRCHMLQDS